MNKINYTFYCFAGHHNADPGAIGVRGLKEADLTKLWRDLIANRVNQLCPDINVVKDNDSMILRDLIAKTKKIIKNVDLLLDIHFNSAATLATGTEAFVDDNASNRSISLASGICKNASDIFGIKNRGVKKESESNRGSLAVLGMSGAAVLWEVSFINNESDVFLQNEWMHWMCDEIARMVVNDYKAMQLKA